MSEHDGLNEHTRTLLHGVLKQHPEIQKAILFGSRAKGTFKAGSDIDLALKGAELTQKTLNRLSEDFDELPTAYEFSLIIYDQVKDADLLAHIERVGISFYERATVQREKIRK